MNDTTLEPEAAREPGQLTDGERLLLMTIREQGRQLARDWPRPADPLEPDNPQLVLELAEVGYGIVTGTLTGRDGARFLHGRVIRHRGAA